jgi:hypothetical protein
MNSLPGLKIWYLVTICIDLIQNRPNSLCLTNYSTYLVNTLEVFKPTTLRLQAERSITIFKILILKLPYFIKYNVHASIVRTWISQWFLAIFFNNNFRRIQDCKFIHHKSHLKPFVSYLPCIMRREYFSIIFNDKKCTP